MSISLRSADVIDESAVAHTCPEELERINNLLNHSDHTTEDLAKAMDSDSIDVDLDLDLYNAVYDLQDAFKGKTGMILKLGYAETAETSSGYDQLDGVYWYVKGSLKRGVNIKNSIRHYEWMSEL